MMYEEKWGEIVTDWLLEDLKLKRKSRRNNTKHFSELKKMGFDGSYRTVCNFIQEWKEARSQTEGGRDDKNYERLSHPPAEAQLDFGLMEAVTVGIYIDVNCLVKTMLFCKSIFSIHH